MVFCGCFKKSLAKFPQSCYNHDKLQKVLRTLSRVHHFNTQEHKAIKPAGKQSMSYIQVLFCVNVFLYVQYAYVCWIFTMVPCPRVKFLLMEEKKCLKFLPPARELMLKLYVFICWSFFWACQNFHALCPSVSEAFQSCCRMSDLPGASENPKCSGGHTKTRAADVKEPLTNVSLRALDFYFGEGAQVTVPGGLMAPFLNGIIFSTGPKWSDALWGPRCCQTVHKLTRKAVASAFPRPLGAVMFTIPRPPALTPTTTPWPVGAAIHQVH